MGPFRGSSPSHIEPRGASVCLRSAELRGPGGSLMDLLDRAEDHRRGALDGPAHQVPWAVTVMYLGKPPVDRHGLAIRAGSHVAASRHAGRYVRCGAELGTQDIGESAFTGFDDGAGVVGDQSGQHGIGVLGVAKVPGAVELMQARSGEAGGSRCRAATRRLPADRRPRREPVPGSVLARRRPGRAPSGGAEAPGEVPGRAVAPTMPAYSYGPG